MSATTIDQQLLEEAIAAFQKESSESPGTGADQQTPPSYSVSQQQWSPTFKSLLAIKPSNIEPCCLA